MAKMKFDQQRLNRQKSIVNKWMQQCDGIGGFIAATGFGKTIVGMIAVKYLRNRGFNGKFAVIVPSTYLVEQWQDRLNSFGLENNVDIITVQTIINWTQMRSYQFVILDELHSYTAEKFRKVFELLDYAFLLGMTATLQEDEERRELIDMYCPIFDEVPLSECLKKGWVSEFVVYNLGIELNGEHRKQYLQLSEKFNKGFAVFGHELPFVFQCLNSNSVCQKHARDLNWDPQRVKIAAVNLVRNMTARKNMLYNYYGIHQKAIEILETFDDRKIITFNQSTDFADALTGYFPGQAMSYHSNVTELKIDGKWVKTKKKIRTHIMERFEQGEFRILNTAKALDQGMDIADIDMSLICSGTASVLQAQQRTGRNIRYKPGKQAIEVNLFIRETQSEKWLQKRLKKHPKHTIKYIYEINEIVI
jgi:superfamily II DNA or RNA helicase